MIPEWAADALIALRENMENGRVANFNEAFKSDKPTERVNTRAARTRKKKATPDVLAEILQLRAKGVSLNDPNMFSQVVENLRHRGVNVNHRDVQEIYALEGQFFKEVPRGPDLKGGYGIGSIIFPKPRRRGRNILHDWEAG